MSSITVCFPEQIVVSSMLSAGISGCNVVVYSVICITSFCFNFLPLYSLLRFLCVYFFDFYCLHISSLPFVEFCNWYLYFLYLFVSPPLFQFNLFPTTNVAK
jgi:hypothetical protein